MGKIATRRTILGAALQLFTTRGFHDTSTARIAREAGVATGTLFHHFASKAELIDALQRLIAGNRRRLLTEAVDPAAAVAEQVRALLLADVRWAVDHPDQERFLRLCRLAPDLAPEARPDDPGRDAGGAGGDGAGARGRRAARPAAQLPRPLLPGPVGGAEQPDPGGTAAAGRRRLHGRGGGVGLERAGATGRASRRSRRLAQSFEAPPTSGRTSLKTSP